jgi:single-strand DNA-binding protein
MFHTIIIVGNLGRDPEMRYTPSGQAVTNFPVATNRQYTGSDGTQVKETVWFRISTWGMAETCAVEERLQSLDRRPNADPATGGPKIWTGQKGPGASFEVTASTVRFLSSRGEEDGGFHGGEAAPMVDDENIPF